MRQLNIMVLASCTSHKGGLEVMCLRLAEALHRRGHRLVLVCRDRGDAFDRFERIASDIYQVKLGPFGFRHLGESLKLLYQLLRICHRSSVDACLTTNVGLARTIGLMAVLGRRPCVFHMGLFNAPDVPIDGFSRWGLLKSAAAIAPTRRAADSWRAIGLAEPRLTVCPNWTDIERFRRRPDPERAGLKRKYGLLESNKTIVFVGRLSEEKGVDVLVRAVAILNAESRFPNLILVGEVTSSYAASLHDLIGALSSDVCMPGNVNNPEDYFAAADIAVVPATGVETFGLTLIEAMASELVVVASESNDFADILGDRDARLLFPTGSVAACADRLRYWLDASESDVLELGSKLRSRVIEHYSMSNVKVYERALDPAVRQLGATTRARS